MIAGVASYVPDDILTNEELSKMVDTTDEWITTRVGIKTRHILKGEGLGSSKMGSRAVKKVLCKTNQQCILLRYTSRLFGFYRCITGRYRLYTQRYV